MKNVNIHFYNLLFCLSLLLVFSLGCKQISNRISEIKSKPNTDRQNYPTPDYNANKNDGEPSLSKKTNLYISECYNKYSTRVTGSFQRYKSWLKDVEAGPTGKEQNIYGLYEINGDGSDCLAAIAKAKQLQPNRAELEEVADKYQVALKEVIQQVKEIYPYYDQQDYKDDNFQKGKNAHPALLKAFTDFAPVNKQFGDELDKLEDEVAQQNLELYRHDGNQKFNFLMTESGIKAKKIARVVQNNEYNLIKAEALQPLIDDFEKSNTEIKSANSNSSTSSIYFSASDNFLKASKELMRRIRDNKPFSDFEKRQLGTFAGWTIEGSPDKVIHYYNELIQRRGII